jgi:hypothetical protein
MNRKTSSVVALSAVMILVAATGPSTTTTPYLVGVAPGIEFTSILTTGDAVKKKHKGNETYRMCGTPDGLGAYDNGDGTITVLMNHELRTNEGIARDHGAAGAFVSKWQIRKSDLKVLNGEDLIQKVMLWDAPGNSYVEALGGTAFQRFCSADLPAVTAFYNAATGKGFSDGRIYMNGEEDAAFGRGMAHLVEGRQHGTSYELAKMGRHAWENLLACPFAQDKTIVIGNEDGGVNRVYVYVGEKQEDGNPVEQAGLTNGSLSELKIEGYTNDDPVTGFRSGRFSLAPSGGGTSLQRPEDGCWDTITNNRYYFVTTAAFTGTAAQRNTRLWRMTFDDIAHPEVGGNIEVLVDGAAPAGPLIRMMDNITVDAGGNVTMLEDVGNQSWLGSVWQYSTTGVLTKLGQHDPDRFAPGAPNFLTQDEESSGVIEVTALFQGVAGYDTANNRYFLLDVQAHFTINTSTPRGFDNPNELVEGGQLLMMKVPR